MTDTPTARSLASQVFGQCIDGRNVGNIRLGELMDAIERAILAAEAAARADVLDSFCAAILHGDDLHRQWLKDAAENWKQGKPVPAPYERARGAK